MTWDELKEKAKSSGVIEVHNYFETNIYVSQRANHCIKFYKNGDVCAIYDDDCDEVEILIAEKLTPDQMHAIMEALQQEVDDER